MNIWTALRLMRPIFAVLLLNFLLYIFNIFLGSNRAIINIDYLFSLLMGKNYINLAYLCLVAGIDVLRAVANVYHFTPISFLENYRMTFGMNYMLNPWVVFGGIFGLGSVFACCKLTCNLIWNLSFIRLICGFVLIALTLMFDIAFGMFNTNGLTVKPLLPNPLHINISTSGVGYLASEYYSRHVVGEDRPDFRSVESSMGIALKNVNNEKQPENIVLIIIESFGVIEKSKIQEKLTRQFSDAIKEKHQVESGSIRFSGATTSGEIRELCGMKGDYKIAMSESNVKNCLPNIFRNYGYITNGYHYYYRSAFSRDVWWPNVGFDKISFLDKYNQKTCGGLFDGGCDGAMISDLFASLNSKKDKTFSYGLTLNSHLPIHDNEYISSIDASRVSELKNLPGQISMLVKSWMVVLDAVANEVNRYPGRDMLVVIVGDHSPPFLSAADRNLFNNEKVPYIIIKTGSQ